MTTTKKIILVPALGALMLVGGAVAGYTGLAAAESTTTGGSGFGKMFRNGPHVGGEITAVNGSTLTVTGRDGTTYTVNAANATVMKEGAASTLTSLAVGEHVHVKGTLDGTTVTAESVMAGMKMGKGGPGGRHGKGPGVMGTVSAINGSTVTVTGMNGTSYVVEAGSATVQKMAAGTLSDIAVGDRIGVQGTVSGTTVTATNIIDDLPAQAGLPEHPVMQ